MLFTYAASPHVRKHGPSGYENYQAYKDWLRDEFVFQCVYCLERERWYPNGHAGFGVDHIKPKGHPENEHLICDYSNLVYACNRCNSAKQDQVFIDPGEVPFADHLYVDEQGEISSPTYEGRLLINVLGLDLGRPTEERKEKLMILRLFRRYPDDEVVRSLYLNAFGFPDDLPDLASRSRAVNSKPEGISQSYYHQKQIGLLPETYGT